MAIRIIIDICLVLFGYALVFICAYHYGKSQPLQTQGTMKIDFDYENKAAKVELEIETDPVLLKDQSFVIFKVDNKVSQNNQVL